MHLIFQAEARIPAISNNLRLIFDAATITLLVGCHQPTAQAIARLPYTREPGNRAYRAYWDVAVPAAFRYALRRRAGDPARLVNRSSCLIPFRHRVDFLL